MSPVDEAELAKDILGVTIRGLVATAGLSLRGFAAMLNVDESYVRGLLDPNDLRRVPSAFWLDRVLRQLGASQSIRSDLEMTLAAAHQGRDSLRSGREITIEQSVISHVRQLKDLHHQARHAVEPALSKSRYARVAQESYALIERLDPNVAPILHIEVCLVANDCYTVLNRPVRALYAARRAQHCAQSLASRGDPRTLLQTHGRCLGSLFVDSLRAAGLVYHCAGLHGWRETVSRQAMRAIKRYKLVYTAAGALCKLDVLQTLIGRRRFTLRSAEGLAREIQDDLRLIADPSAAVIHARTLQWLAGAYLAYGRHYGHTPARARKTEVLLFEVLAQFESMPWAGPVCRASAFEMMAHYYDAVGDTRSRDHYLDCASGVAEQAGLLRHLQRFHDAGPRGVPAPRLLNSALLTIL